MKILIFISEVNIKFLGLSSNSLVVQKLIPKNCGSHDSMQYEKVVFCGIWCRMGERNLVIVADIMYTSRMQGSLS